MSNLVTLMQQIKEEGAKLGFSVSVNVHASTGYVMSGNTVSPPVEVEVTPVVEAPVAEKPAPKRKRKPAAKKPVVEEVEEEEVEDEEEDEEEVEDEVEDEDEEITIDTLIPLVKKAIADHGKVAVKSLLEEFGIAKLSELDKQYYAEFKERLEEECP